MWASVVDIVPAPLVNGAAERLDMEPEFGEGGRRSVIQRDISRSMASKGQLNERRVVKDLPHLDDLGALNSSELIALLTRLVGSAPKAKLSAVMLRKIAAYALQAKKAGAGVKDIRKMLGLKTMIRAKAGELNSPALAKTINTTANGLNTLLETPNRKTKPKRAANLEPLPAGTRLIRHWRGEVHEVIVQSDRRYLWRGTPYGSLSEIAKLITGTIWSGPRFFGTGLPAKEAVTKTSAYTRRSVAKIKAAQVSHG